jgi:dTDP-4-amino-4,6-dideoxygalactose transaminase
MIPFIDLKAQYEVIKDEIRVAIDGVLESQCFILGPKVAELERRVADYCGVKHAIGVASGSDALLLALTSLDIGQGDEVITTPFTFFATAGSIARVGATPVFVDIDPKTYNIDSSKIQAAITEKTKAIMPVHLYGQCADMVRIKRIAEQNGLYVIEDAAQAIGAAHHGKKAGSMGHTGCLSFYPTKNLGGCGDGGMVLTDFDSIAEKVRMLRNHGGKDKLRYEYVGMNSRLDEIQAAVLLVKLRHLPRYTMDRRCAAISYGLSFPDTMIPSWTGGDNHVFNQYTISVIGRDDLRKTLKKLGISTMVYYPVPLHLQPAFKYLGYKQDDFPHAEYAARHVLSLPVVVSGENQQKIIRVIGELINHHTFRYKLDEEHERRGGTTTHHYDDCDVSNSVRRFTYSPKQSVRLQSETRWQREPDTARGCVQ